MKLWQASSFSPMGPIFLICTWRLEAVGLICLTIQDHTFGFCFGNLVCFLNFPAFSRGFGTNLDQHGPIGTHLAFTNSDGHLHFLWSTDRHLYTVRRLATPPWSTRWPKNVPKNDPAMKKDEKRAVTCRRKSSSKTGRGHFIYNTIGYNRHSNSCIKPWEL